MSPVVKSALKRLGVTFVIGMVFAFVVAEGSYQMAKGNSERAPRQIEILIPPGTADAIASGESGPGLPDMRFAEDDQILVRNMDSVPHQLGPLWVPANSSSVLTLDRPSSYSLSCTFQASQTIDIEVVARAKTSDRVLGILSIGLPTWILIWVYTLIGIPMPAVSQQPADEAK
ncbi:MAG: hypothetical protein ACYC3H_10470 [Bellilinea sp.]|jgi:hypothetical protein